MKPIKLEFLGIKSYVDKTVVDFESLSKGGLFGIFGSTGSGKSTILDCIFIALYGRLKSSIHQSDFLNKKVSEAFIDFTFDIVENGEYHRYNVLRQFRNIENKKNQPTPKAFVFEIVEGEKIPRAERVDSCNEFLLQTIGLNIDDFSKCIVLPQGEFSAFVTQKRGDRLSMMAGLFNLSKYGSLLVEKLKVRENEFLIKMRTLENEKSKLGAISNKDLDGQKKLLDDSENEIKILDVKRLKIEEEYNDYKKNYETHNCLLENKKEKLELEKIKDKIEEKKFILDNFEKAKQIVDSFNKTLSRKEEISNLEEVLIKEKTKLETLEKLASEQVLKDSEIEKMKNGLEEKKNSLSILKSLSFDFEELKKIENSISQKLLLHKQKRDILLKLENNFSILQKERDGIEKEIKEFNFDLKIQSFVDKLSASEINKIVEGEKEFLSLLDEYLSEQGKNLSKKRKMELDSLIKTIDDIDYSSLKSILATNEELFAKRSAIKDKLSQENSKISSLKLELEKILEEGKNERERQEQILQKLQKYTSEKSFEKAVYALGKEVESLFAKIKAIEDKKLEIDKQKEGVKFSIAKISAQLETAKNELLKEIKEYESVAKFSLDKANAIFSCEKEISTIKEQVDKFQQSYSKTLFEIERLESVYVEQEYSLEILEEKKKALEDIKAKFDKLKENIYNYRINYKKLWQNFEESAIIEKDLQAVCEKLDLFSKLRDLLKASALVDFIAEEYLQYMAIDANDLLLSFTSGKFGLKYNSNFYVVDYSQGGEVRKVETTSGGELFLVSLSLALALSKSIYARNNRPVEFFFLDEGFGSLDTEILSSVGDILENLSRTQNVSIGVISHVETLKERILSKITVSSATEKSGSKISSY